MMEYWQSAVPVSFSCGQSSQGSVLLPPCSCRHGCFAQPVPCGWLSTITLCQCLVSISSLECESVMIFCVSIIPAALSTPVSVPITRLATSQKASVSLIDHSPDLQCTRGSFSQPTSSTLQKSSPTRTT